MLMKTNLLPSCSRWRSLVAGLAAFAVAGSVALATPYASSLTNNGASGVSFRLNESADQVLLVTRDSGGGYITNDLGPVPAGLTNVTTIPTDPGFPFQVICSKAGSGAITQIGSSIAFNSPRGVAVNRNPASPFFGRVYVANSANSATVKGQGIYVYEADLSNPFGASTNLRTAGYNFSLATGGSAPFQITVGPDGQLYVTDWSDATGNLIVTDPDVTTHQYVLKPLTGTAAIPVGVDNNHGSVQSVAVVGSLAGNDLQIITVDEDYQQDPTATFAYQMNSVWRYDVGGGPLPYAGTPVLLAVPSVNFVSQNDDVVVGPNGYIYFNQRRANASGPPGVGTWSPSLYIINPEIYIDPTNYAAVYNPDPANQPGQPGCLTLTSNYWAHSAQGGFIWESQSASTDIGSNGADYLLDINGVSVSRDGRYLAGLTYGANNLIIVPLTNGIPDLSQRFNLAIGGSAAGRDVAWDPANNIFIASSGLGQVRYYTLGVTATTITTSDGQFLISSAATTVSISNAVATAYEQGNASASFALIRASDGEDYSQPLTVNLTIGGTATRAANLASGDYAFRTNGVVVSGNSIVIPAGTNLVFVETYPTNDLVIEPTETITINLAAGGNYSINPAARNITQVVVDNEPPQILATAASASMYERLTNDYVRVTVTRWGDTNTSLVIDTTNFTFAGTATLGADYYVTNFWPYMPATLDPGQVTTNIYLLFPIDDNLLEGNESIIIGTAAGDGFTGATNLVTATLVDDENAAETVLWSDNFNVDSSASWDVFFATTNNAPEDYTVNFAYDYYASQGIPPAPRSSADTLGVRLAVNKNDDIAVAAALNLYPKGRSFSGNFALRFDMFLIVNSISGTTEYALFGINHSGTKTNWFRNSAGGVPAGWLFDGLFYGVETDAAALGDYVLYSSPTTAGNNPTALTPGRNASTLTGVFKAPPFAYAGAPANPPFSFTPSWVDVEISQINNAVTLKIDNTVIFTYTNTTPYTSGNIMLGMNDGYDSIGNGGAGAGESAVIYDNVRVVSLSGIKVNNVQRSGNNTTINFSFDLNDSASNFRVQSASVVSGPYADATATITQTGPNSYQAVVSSTAAVQFYRIRHL